MDPMWIKQFLDIELQKFQLTGFNITLNNNKSDMF